MSSKKHSRNLAARMGCWSARHRALAIFGWLAFVVVAFGVGMFVIGPKQATEASGPGESGRAIEILDEGLQAARRRERAHPERLAARERSGVPGRDRSGSCRASDPAGRHEHPFPARCRERGSDLRRRSFGARRFQVRGEADVAATEDRADSRRRCRSAGVASRALHRRVRWRERGQGARGVLHG